MSKKSLDKSSSVYLSPFNTPKSQTNAPANSLNSDYSSSVNLSPFKTPKSQTNAPQNSPASLLSELTSVAKPVKKARGRKTNKKRKTKNTYKLKRKLKDARKRQTIRSTIESLPIKLEEPTNVPSSIKQIESIVVPPSLRNKSASEPPVGKAAFLDSVSKLSNFISPRSRSSRSSRARSSRTKSQVESLRDESVDSVNSIIQGKIKSKDKFEL